MAPLPGRGIVEADFDPNNGTSSNDDSFEDIEYVSFEDVNDVDQEEKEFDLEDILQIQDVILREKLLNISRLITNIESLKDNPNPIPVTDSDSSDTSLSHSNNSLPEFESFSDHTEETRSGKPPNVEICLHFEPDVPMTIPSHLSFGLFFCFSPTPRFLLYLAPSGVKIRSLTLASSLRAGGISFASPRTNYSEVESTRDSSYKNKHFYLLIYFLTTYEKGTYPGGYFEDSRAPGLCPFVRASYPQLSFRELTKRIFRKRTKNKAKNDKTGHGMEKCEKTKPKKYWWCTKRALDTPGGGPHLIVDDGGDATLLIYEGVKAKEEFAKTRKVPYPSLTDNAEFHIMLSIIKEGFLSTL
ncbi:hypothetical protein Tco_0989307 [Tanacetum coccineum]|uniref:Uncharacterized protein n=1 Tax=Tanacetum coccineum TaxID=301880 RepID=A0ABQ5ETA1_9ASTR